MTHASVAALSAPARSAPPSGIVEVFNYGRGRAGLIPLWVGEGDRPTPAFISEAALASLGAGETFYTAQRGLPDLRAALSRHHANVYGIADEPERFFVTGGGMQAIQIALRMAAGAGDEVLVPTPAWPNFQAAIGINGAVPVAVPMSLGNDGWTLDLDRLAAAVTPRTRALVINSPSNPTGWTATRAELQAVLNLARTKDLWIVADEVYGRFVYDGVRAASFHDVAEPGDKVIYVNTFSKNWAMSGWRVGWIEADPALGQTIESLVQYSTSGVPAFLQRGAIAALEQGETFLADQIAQARRNRSALVEAFGRSGRVRFAEPDGAFYLFVSIDGFSDTRRLGLQLVDEAGVGVAPGAAFGAGAESFLRLCFLRDPAEVAIAAERLSDWIAKAVD